MFCADFLIRVPKIAVGVSVALCLAGCGSTGAQGGRSASHSSTRVVATSQSSSAIRSTATRSPATPTPKAVLEHEHAAEALAIETYSRCLSARGIDVPPQNTEVLNPSFNSKGLKTSSRRFKHASAKCLPAAVAILRGHGG